MKKINCLYVIQCAILSIIIAFFACFANLSLAHAQTTEKSVSDTIQDILAWKRKNVGSSVNGTIFTTSFLEGAGTTNGDWFPIGMSRYGIKDNYTAYHAKLQKYVEDAYKTSAKLSNSKATEWHRISLSALATGADPTKFGHDKNGQPINLIADGTYNHVFPGRQGINGWIWGLIALDSHNYSIPDSAKFTRENFIIQLINKQRADGGFSLFNNSINEYNQISEIDITSMVIQALSPYYNDEKIYTYTFIDKGPTTFHKSVHQVIDESLAFLASEQNSETGDFSSYNQSNCESTCQVLVAISSLGLDPLKIKQFDKNNKNLFDVFIKYQVADGGFTHSFAYDPENPTSQAGESNGMATDQALYTLAALYRANNNMRSLYDMLPDFNKTQRAVIDTAINSINALTTTPTDNQLITAIDNYRKVPATDKKYVNNYWTLSSLAKANDFGQYVLDDTITLPPLTPEYSQEFTKNDIDTLNALPSLDKIDTSITDTVNDLKYKLDNCDPDIANHSTYVDKVNGYINELTKLNTLITSIANEINTRLRPLTHVTYDNKTVINEVYNKYMALSQYDRENCFSKADKELVINLKEQADKITAPEPIDPTPGFKAEFTKNDIDTLNALPSLDKIDTSITTTINDLKYKLDNCDPDIANHSTYVDKVNSYLAELTKLNEVIADIKNDITTRLRPIMEVTFGDKELIYDIYNRFMALNEYDRQNMFLESDVKLLNSLKQKADNVVAPTPTPDPEVKPDVPPQPEYSQEFTSEDEKKMNALPSIEHISTQIESVVLELKYKLDNCDPSIANYNRYKTTLEQYIIKIDQLKAEIHSIQADIKQYLYPFNSISLKDKDIIYSIYNRFMALNEYDRENQFLESDVEGLLKSKTQVDNLKTAIIITSCCSVAIVILVIIVIINIKHRKKLKKAKQMPESEE